MKFMVVDFNNSEVDVLASGVSTDVVLVYAMGASQAEPVEMFAALRSRGYRVYMTRKPAAGMASTKFFVFATLGQLMQRYPQGRFTVVSNERSYDQVVAYLHSKGMTNVRRLAGSDLRPVEVDKTFTLQDEVDALVKLSRVTGKYAAEVEQEIALLARLDALATPKAVKPVAHITPAEQAKPVPTVKPVPTAQPVEAEGETKPLAVITLRRVTKPKAKVAYSSQAILRTHPLAGVSMIPTVVQAV